MGEHGCLSKVDTGSLPLSWCCLWACVYFNLVHCNMWEACWHREGNSLQLKELESIALLSRRTDASGWAVDFYLTPWWSRRPVLISAADDRGCRIKFLFSLKWLRSWIRWIWIASWKRQEFELLHTMKQFCALLLKQWLRFFLLYFHKKILWEASWVDFTHK